MTDPGMTHPRLDAYLAELARELRRLGIVDPRIVAEARDHLVDAVEREVARGQTVDAAEEEAIARFGAPRAVAATFAGARRDVHQRALFVCATLAGLGIAWVDARPSWDDTGVTASAMMLAAGLCGFLGVVRPWRWAVLIGLWIPAYAVARTQSPWSLIMLVVIAFPLAGAYVGSAIRRSLMAG